MKHDRILKAQSICKKIIAEFITQYLQEETAIHGIITVTGIKIASELSYLDVYVSCLKEKETLAKDLALHAGEIQRILGKNIDFLKVPRVRFRYDDSGENSFQIYSTIKQLDIP